MSGTRARTGRAASCSSIGGFLAPLLGGFLFEVNYNLVPLVAAGCYGVVFALVRVAARMEARYEAGLSAAEAEAGKGARGGARRPLPRRRRATATRSCCWTRRPWPSVKAARRRSSSSRG
jgi:hypothetical protein